jgi:AraC-like DNA-binding protein/CheY-like chemotaxis protein
MSALTGVRSERYALVTAAHHFLLDVLPFRHVHSRRALNTFVHIASASPLPRAEIGAILVKVLAVLNPQTAGRLPTLVDRYLADQQYPAEAIERFRECVGDVIRYRGIGCPEVQQAVAIIEACHTDSTLTQRSVADRCGISPRELSVLFGAQTGESFSHYLRNARLDEAATLLTTTNETVKEIWAAVGYNHASNFDHDFKQRFGVPPREYRTHAIRPYNSDRLQRASGAAPCSPDRAAGNAPRVTIIDDNFDTLDTIAHHLRMKGYDVAAASTGEEGWRAVADSAVHAIVVDYHLPDTDGIEWLRKVRRLRPSLGASALIFTADWELADRIEEMRALGAFFVSKLCDLNELERLVASLCWMQRLHAVQG